MVNLDSNIVELTVDKGQTVEGQMGGEEGFTMVEKSQYTNTHIYTCMYVERKSMFLAPYYVQIFRIHS